MEQGLYQNQKMKVSMTAELGQAISLLQLSTIDLAEYIKENVFDNPLIELEENEPIKEYDSTSYHQKADASSYSSIYENVPAREQGLQEKLSEQIGYLNFDKRT